MRRLALCVLAVAALLMLCNMAQAQSTVAGTIGQQVQVETDGVVKVKAKFRARGFFRPAGAFGFRQRAFLGFGLGGYTAPFQSLRFQQFGYAPPMQLFQGFNSLAVDPCAGQLQPPIGGLRFSEQFRSGY